MKSLYLLFFALLSQDIHADFKNNRIQYNDAIVENQIDLALSVLEQNFPLSQVSPLKKNNTFQYQSLQEFFIGQIDLHKDYQSENEKIREKYQEKTKLDPGTAHSNSDDVVSNNLVESTPKVPKVPKEMSAYFICMQDNLQNLKRLEFLKRLKVRSSIEEQEFTVLNEVLNRTRGFDGRVNLNSNLCGVHLGKAGFLKLTNLQELKLSYALGRLMLNKSYDEAKNLLTIYVAANHSSSKITLRDTWRFAVKYMTLLAYSKNASLLDRDQLIKNLLEMRSKLLPKTKVIEKGKGTETIRYFLRNIEKDLVQSYDQALELLNAKD